MIYLTIYLIYLKIYLIYLTIYLIYLTIYLPKAARMRANGTQGVPWWLN